MARTRPNPTASGGRGAKLRRTGTAVRRTRTVGTQTARVANQRNRMVSVPRNKLGFPQSMSTTLRFVSRVDFDVGSSTQHIVFNANGMYDPLVAIGGHQPRGFDEYMKIYQTYTVTGASIACNMMFQGYDGPSDDSATTGEMIKTIAAGGTDQPAVSPVICGLHKGLQVLTSGAAEVQMEKDRTVWKILTPSNGAVVLATKMAVSDFYGKGKLVGATGYTGNNARNPDEIVYFDLWAARGSGTSQGECKVVAYCTLEFKCVFTEPVVLVAS